MIAHKLVIGQPTRVHIHITLTLASVCSLVTVYQRLHDALHARSGQPEPLRLVYVKTQYEACLAWMTKPFELYIAVSPHLSKAAVVGAANAVAKWVGAEEARVFIKDAPVF